MDATDLARWQFDITTVITIGLPAVVAYFQTTSPSISRSISRRIE